MALSHMVYTVSSKQPHSKKMFWVMHMIVVGIG